MTSLINTESGASLKALKYSPPTKFTPVAISIDGEAVDARVTSARGKSYTYFPLRGVGFYVEGALESGQSFSTDGLPEGELKGPAWDSARKSYYVHKRPKKAKEGEDAEQNGEAQSGAADQADSAEQGQTETAAAEGESSSAPRARRKRGE